MFYHEVRHFETQQHKDDSTLKYLHLLSEKLVFRIRSEPIMSFSLPMFDEWDSYKKEFKAKIEENIEVHMPEDDGISKYVYLCIKKHPVEKFEFDLIQITIPFFIVDKVMLPTY